VTLVVDVAPRRFAEPLGIVCTVLVLALVLSVIVRLIAGLFSRSIRASIVAHEVGHAVWFGAAIGIVLLALLLPRAKFKHSSRQSPNHSVQATPVYAFCQFLSQVPGAPDRARWPASVS
jgi:hypothetical protein